MFWFEFSGVREFGTQTCRRYTKAIDEIRSGWKCLMLKSELPIKAGAVVPLGVYRDLFRNLCRGGWHLAVVLAIVFGVWTWPTLNIAQERIPYRQKDLTVDLGVGLWAWPMPIDWDQDGDLDLIVSCPDVPYNGTYFFENKSDGKQSMPIFEPAVRVGKGLRSPQVSYVAGHAHVLTAGQEYLNFRQKQFQAMQKIYPKSNIHGKKRIRANQWKYCDFDGDGKTDLLIGVGDWTDYGWDNAFNSKGDWTNGPLRGFVYLLKNKNSNQKPEYQSPVKLQANGKPIDVFGMPSPCLEDFDNDGDLDLLCGEFIDGFTYFQNTGTRTAPLFSSGVRLKAGDGKDLRMDLQMITPTAIDWDRDGDVDLICGDEDGRVAFLENKNVSKAGLPVFAAPQYFQQKARDLKFGALVTPVSIDWDQDGDEDLICGNTAGYIGFIENVSPVDEKLDSPTWAKPRYLRADGQVIRFLAGENGSIQGPAESKWGYTTLSVADWDHDGRLDLVVNSIWGKVVWFKNVGTAKDPRLARQQSVEVSWKGTPQKPAWNWWSPRGNELSTQWRTTPVVFDWNEDGLNDLVMLDHEGYLAFYERTREQGQLQLSAPQRIFQTPDGKALRLNSKTAGGSGRRKICLADWDGDGRVDLLVNSSSVDWYKNVSDQKGIWVFKHQGALGKKKLAGHTTSPTIVDWDRNGRPDLLIGAEDGFFYFVRNSPNSNPTNSNPSD